MAYKLLFPLLIVTTVATADPSEPLAIVENSVAQTIKILKDSSSDHEMRWIMLGSIFNKDFDFRSMSKDIPPSNWRRVYPEERRQFINFSSQYIESIFRDKIENYSYPEIKFMDKKVNADLAVIETLIIIDDTETRLHYKLRSNDKTWLIYDVMVEGVSLLSNYRDMFSSIVRHDGMDGLLNSVQIRISKYRIANRNKAESSKQN